MTVRWGSKPPYSILSHHWLSWWTKPHYFPINSSLIVRMCLRAQTPLIPYWFISDCRNVFEKLNLPIYHWFLADCWNMVEKLNLPVLQTDRWNVVEGLNTKPSYFFIDSLLSVGIYCGTKPPHFPLINWCLLEYIVYCRNVVEKLNLPIPHWFLADCWNVV